MEVVEAVWESVRIGAGLFWKAFWALAFGYAISAGIQVFLSRREAAKHLGSASPGQLGLAMGFGFASSSCSFAALAATRSLFAKGAHAWLGNLSIYLWRGGVRLRCPTLPPFPLEDD